MRSTISVIGFTFGYATYPFASASGWPGSKTTRGAASSSSTRAYEANVAAVNATKRVLEAALSIGR